MTIKGIRKSVRERTFLSSLLISFHSSAFSLQLLLILFSRQFPGKNTHTYPWIRFLLPCTSLLYWWFSFEFRATKDLFRPFISLVFSLGLLMIISCIRIRCWCSNVVKEGLVFEGVRVEREIAFLLFTLSFFNFSYSSLHYIYTLLLVRFCRVFIFTSWRFVEKRLRSRDERKTLTARMDSRFFSKDRWRYVFEDSIFRRKNEWLSGCLTLSDTNTRDRE